MSVYVWYPNIKNKNPNNLASSRSDQYGSDNKPALELNFMLE